MTTANNLLPHLFRTEYTKMTAVLCRHFGLKHIEIAEDIASETFLKAFECWPTSGIPDNPTSWLYRVAKNKTLDYLRRNTLFEKEIRPQWQAGQTTISPEINLEFSPKTIADSQLAMIFAVCQPHNSPEAQVCLALQILCGFSVEEIASAFLAKAETIKKRLYRARNNLRNQAFELETLSEKEILERLNTVLQTLYLFFNEGYFSQTNQQQTRQDLCAEAVRLMLILVENPLTNTPETNALLSLMCYQSSRLAARTDEAGQAILFEQQDQTLWDKTLIDKGNYYLVKAFSQLQPPPSRYHLQASIAYWHAAPPCPDKWPYILQLYDQLTQIESSSIMVLSRLFAVSKVHGAAQAIAETQVLAWHENVNYEALLGYLYGQTDASETAIAHYQKAITLSQSSGEKQMFAKHIAALRKG
ncbi:RNA polymerase sigma-70 factor, ECF subfamily [Flexibacter flexilis DSM 6793]|uniref:RNA polymerase sigma-70 factor, ECF subfamily n=1 Tax=Flexibacter flexilis DSM 6793 TaxID=927664 RepID=A0A1I1FMR0_9BACT|nr:DUF6596 domain-containing protein [Flexibacter flexilis]SFC00819.1 RNA polymerase sigma-70 factor, ECF subfamily [Flexibacter flexilis DSM 6793]